LGDAVAMCLLELRDFTNKDFAQYHPGGSLGKKLYLKVKDIYPHNEKPSVTESADIQQVILEMTSKRLGCTAVLNHANELIGIITDGDLRRMLNRFDGFKNITARDIMTHNPKSILPNDYAAHALEVMQEKNITQLVVVENRQLMGFIHLHDLLKEGLV
jgi:arabinose-5-phosphate isomerase